MVMSVEEQKKLAKMIPFSPYTSYKKEGFTSMSDYLGSENESTLNRKYPTLVEAKKILKKLKLKGKKDYAKNRPNNLPSNPYLIYKDQGWKGMSDYLGHGEKKEFLPYDKAKKIVRKLGFKTVEDYLKNRPKNVPANPSYYYKDKGWENFAKYLGTGRDKNYLPFKEARKVIQKLNCKNVSDFMRKRPKRISASPDRYYQDKGWVSWSDFLGNGKIATAKIIFPTYEEAKKIVIKKRVTCQMDYRVRKIKGLPSSPERTYKDKGWVNWYVFLGKE